MNRKPWSVTVRLAKPGDAEPIANLSTQLGYPVSTREMKKRLKVVGDNEDQRIYVAVAHAFVVGWIEIFLPRSVLNTGKAEIGALVVDVRYRRLGAGTALMTKAQKWAHEKRCPFIYLRSNIVRDDARKFYERSGYDVFKTQNVFRKLLGNRRKRHTL